MMLTSFESTATELVDGSDGQAIIVVPSRDLVIIRVGLTHDREALDLDALIGKVLAALPEPT